MSESYTLAFVGAPLLQSNVPKAVLPTTARSDASSDLKNTIGSTNGIFWRATAGLAAGLALRTTRTRRNYMDQQAAAAAKSRREVDDFWQQRSRAVNFGKRTKGDRYWQMEERTLFQKAHVTAGINFDKYKDIPVECEGGTGDNTVVESFQEACDKYNLPPELTANLSKCGYDKPTPVQKYSIPAVLDGADVMVSAQTGSGKTAAFLVPIVSTALNAGCDQPDEGPVRPSALVLAPTRELVQQIEVEARRLCYKTQLNVVACYGGEAASRQLTKMSEGVDIIIATPGRLDDFCNRGVISMENIKFLALDEADRMLDMGFEPAVRSIIEDFGMPEKEEGRNTIMFSATFPPEMQDMALDYLDPAYMGITVGKLGVTVTDVEQRFVDCTRLDKFAALDETLNNMAGEIGDKAKTLVFANTKNTCDQISNNLYRSRIRAAVIHGDKSQAARDSALESLKAGFNQVLVATEVAARGLDLPGIDHVINFDLPTNHEDYVHRIGRTGRIGNKGIATSFVSFQESSLPGIVKDLREKSEDGDGEGAPDWLEDMAGGNRMFAPRARYGTRRGPPQRRGR